MGSLRVEDERQELKGRLSKGRMVLEIRVRSARLLA